MINKLKKENFYPTGAVETSLIYFYRNTVGAALSVNETGLVLSDNGVSKFFIGKKGIDDEYKKWRKLSFAKYKSEYFKWQKKWKNRSKLLYKIINDKDNNWIKNWKIIDSLAEDFWKDSYKVEITDQRADEIFEELRSIFTPLGASDDEINELITPDKLTHTQKPIDDSKKVSLKKISNQAFVKRYWYILGTWSGGKIADNNTYKEIMSGWTDFSKSIKKRKIIHVKYKKSGNNYVDELIKKLRIIYLWREERKTYLQMMNLCLNKIAIEGSKETSVPYKSFVWLRPEELNVPLMNEIVEKRSKRGVFVSWNKNKSEFLGKDVGKHIFTNFEESREVSLIKGTVASKGKVQGIARVILKQHQFHRFQRGEILVTTMTRPEFMPLMLKASGIITDEGGLTSHAAIVSRELKIPCIVGTKKASNILQDGDLVEVDAINGVVKII